MYEKKTLNHNHKTLQNSNKIIDEDSKSCNCRSKANYPDKKGMSCLLSFIQNNSCA